MLREYAAASMSTFDSSVTVMLGWDWAGMPSLLWQRRWRLARHF
jgi:hypothetical protein